VSFYDANYVPFGANGKLAVALLMVRTFGETVPAVETLVRRFDMNRATAYRWRAAYARVRGGCADGWCPPRVLEALRLAHEFGVTRPTVDALHARLGGAHRATAFRYRKSWDVLGAVA
jgi:hypothetical protein